MMEEEKKKRKESKVEELSDAEFVSFLYAERTRENSLSRYQGWNIWALALAIVTVVCTAYCILKENLTLIGSSRFLYYVSGLVAFMLSYSPIRLLFAKERGVDYRKLKTVKEVSPSSYLLVGFIVTFSFSVLIPIVDKASPWNVVSIGWMVAFVLYMVGKVSCRINRNMIVCPGVDEVVFANSDLDRWYGLLTGFVLLVIGNLSFRRFPIIIGAPEFELAVCVASLVLLGYLLIIVFKSEKTSNKIDVLIDEYVYKGVAKETIFWKLRVNRMGHTVLEACINEVLDIGRSFDEYNQKKCLLEEVDKVFVSGTVDATKVKEYYQNIEEAQEYLSKSLRQCHALIERLREVEKQAPSLKDDEDYIKLVQMCSVQVGRIEEMMDAMKTTSSRVSHWINQFHCDKCGGVCIRDCEHRHDRKSLGFGIRYWWKTVKVRKRIHR